MSIEKPTAEEEIENERIHHTIDARMGGATWAEDDPNRPGELRLKMTDDQVEAARKEMEEDLSPEVAEKRLNDAQKSGASKEELGVLEERRDFLRRKSAQSKTKEEKVAPQVAVVSERTPSSVLTEEERDALMNGLKGEGKTKKEKASKKKTTTKKTVQNEVDEDVGQRNSQEKEIAKLERELSKKSKAGASKEELGELKARRDQLKKEVEASDREEASFWTKTFDALPLEQKKAELEKIFNAKSKEDAPAKELREIEVKRKALSDEEKHAALLTELKEKTAEKRAERYGFENANAKAEPQSKFWSWKTAGSILKTGLGLNVFSEIKKLKADRIRTAGEKAGTKDAVLDLLNSVSEDKKDLKEWQQNPDIGDTIQWTNNGQERFPAGAYPKIIGHHRDKNREVFEIEYVDTDGTMKKGFAPTNEVSVVEKTGWTEKPQDDTPVRDKIKAFNEKLRDVKLPDAEKQGLRDQMAKVLWEHRHITESIDKEKTEKIGKVLDAYVNTSSQNVAVAREAMNTGLLIASPFCPAAAAARMYSFTAFSALMPMVKAEQHYHQKHLNDTDGSLGGKLAHITKETLYDSTLRTHASVKEQYLKHKRGEQSLWQTTKGVAGSTLPAAMFALRLGGITGVNHLLAERLASGDYASHVNGFFDAIHKSPHPQETLHGIMNGTELAHHIGSGNTHELVTNDPKLLQELTIIKQGGSAEELIRNQLIYAVKAGNKNFGVPHGVDIHHLTPKAEVALREWAGKRAHVLAEQNGLVGHGIETRFLDSKIPSQVIVHGDGSIHVTHGGNEYIHHDTAQHIPGTHVVHTEEALKQKLGAVGEAHKQTADMGGKISPEHVTHTATTQGHQSVEAMDSVVWSDKDTGSNGTIQFLFNSHGKVSGINFDTKGVVGLNGFNEKMHYLKDNWRETIASNPIARIDKDTFKDIDAQLTKIFFEKKVLHKLILERKGSGVEAAFLKADMIRNMSVMERYYGNIFKSFRGVMNTRALTDKDFINLNPNYD